MVAYGGAICKMHFVKLQIAVYASPYSIVLGANIRRRNLPIQVCVPTSSVKRMSNRLHFLRRIHSFTA